MFAAAACRWKQKRDVDDEKEVVDVVFLPNYLELVQDLPSSFIYLPETKDTLSETYFDSSRIRGLKTEISQRVRMLASAARTVHEFERLVEVIERCEVDQSIFLVITPFGKYAYPVQYEIFASQIDRK